MVTEQGRATLALIKARRSVRRFTDGRPSDEDLLDIVEAGQWAPSASNRQPCVFVVVDDPDRVAALEAVSPGVIGHPAAVVVIGVRRRGRSVPAAKPAGAGDASAPPGQPGEREVLEAAYPMDAAMAAQNMLLEATALGLGSCPVLSFDPPSVSRLLGLPADVEPQLLVTLGYAAQEPRVPPRKPLAEVLWRNRFGRPFAANQSGQPLMGGERS